MKRLYAIILVFLFLTFPTHAMVKQDPLLLMTHTLQKEHIQMEKWEVVIKEHLTKQAIKTFLTQKEYMLSQETTERAMIYNFELNNDISQDLKVVLKLIIPKDPYAASELIAVIKNDTFNQTMKEQYEFVKTFLHEQFFSENARLFACIKLNSGAIINENNFFDKLQQMFKINNPIVHNDSTKDKKSYDIMYGQSHLFPESLKVNDHSMNVHLVKRIAHNEETAFFIGTPILLNEY